MNRRGFLGSILAACAAPAIVRADSLMRIVPTDTFVLGIGAYDVTVEAGPSYSASAREALEIAHDHARLITATISGVYAPDGKLARFTLDRIPLVRGGQTIKLRIPNPYTRARI